LSLRTDSSRKQGGNPDVSIVIVSWNTRDILRDCLQSIIRETRRPYEVIVVDNTSSDGSAAMIEAKYPQVVLIANNENVGFAAAVNQGIKVATGRYLLILNPDTVILEHAIDKMIGWCDDHPDVGCAGCQVLATDGSIQPSCFSDPNPLNLFMVETGLHRLLPRYHTHEYVGWDRRSEKDVDVVAGMFMIIPRGVLDKVGLMDESYFIYVEEADLCRRIRQTGLRCVFTPIAQVIHHGGRSTRQLQRLMHVRMQKSTLIYMKKYYGMAGFVWGKAVYIASSIFKIAVFVPIAVMSRRSEALTRVVLARSALMFAVFGTEPK
jgi:GT2 family glycosyltransferase